MTRIGDDGVQAIMYDTYYMPPSNQDLQVTTIVQKDNGSTAEVPEGTWEINEGWDVDFPDDKTIRINKFRIDTWGIRHKVPGNSPNSDKYKKMAVETEGLSYVNENIIKSNAQSETATGFANAYVGTVGYVVEWFPGQFASGNYVKGLVIQGQMCYTDGWNTARDNSYAMGRAPWEINGTRDRFVNDGWRPIGMMTGGGCSAFCIGLFGGCQTAASVGDTTSGAYRLYDISEHPIILHLDIPDRNAPADASSVECWDAYAGEENIYHKDRTVENCWKEYGMASDKVMTDFGSYDYISLDMAGIPSDIKSPLLPDVTDLEEYILPANDKPHIKWNAKIANTEFWDKIKSYLETHPVINVESDIVTNNSTYGVEDNNGNVLHRWFRSSNISGDLIVKFDGAFRYGTWYEGFVGVTLRKLTLQFLQDNLLFSVMQYMFRHATISEIEVLDKDGNPSNKFLGGRDSSGAFEGSGIEYIPDIIDWRVKAVPADGERYNAIQYMCSYCAKLVEIAQASDDREAFENRIDVGGCMQAFQGCGKLVRIGPVLNMRQAYFQDFPKGDTEAAGYKMFEGCTSLADARIKNLHGSYVNFADNEKHGHLPALDSESVAYMFDNLMDETPDRAELHIPSSWVSESFDFSNFAKYTDKDTIIINTRMPTSSSATDHYTSMGGKAKVRVEGLAAGDILGIGSGTYDAIQNKVTEDGTYEFEFSSAWGFKLWNTDTSITSAVTITSLPVGDLRVTDEMILAANAKGWHVFVNGDEIIPS